MKQAARTPKQIGALIRRERRKRAMTQAQLGELIGLRQATISKLEAGQPTMQLKTLFDVLAALGLEFIVMPRGSDGDEFENVF